LTGLGLRAGLWATTLAANAADLDGKPMMTIAERKRDAQGNLLPLQSYAEINPAQPHTGLRVVG